MWQLRSKGWVGGAAAALIGLIGVAVFGYEYLAEGKDAVAAAESVLAVIAVLATPAFGLGILGVRAKQERDEPEKSRGSAHVVTLLFAAALALPLAACGTTAGGGPDSPGTAGAPATATGVIGAQTARDLGLGETPQTATTGTSTILWKFASEGDARVMMRMLDVAEAAGWTAEQIAQAFQALNGAPETVQFEITGGEMQAISGHAQQTGSTAGQGGANRGLTPTPTND